MERVSFEVPPEQKAMLTERARSLGVSLATYSRNLVLDGSKRNGHDPQAEVLRAIRALIPILVRLSPKVASERYEEWLNTMQDGYEKLRARP